MNIPKFRAWHKEYKVMKPVLEMDFDPDKGIFVESKQPEYDDGKYRMYGEYWFWREIELMLWTGREDKNGVEVYEGDIVKANYPWEDWADTQKIIKLGANGWNYSYDLAEFGVNPEQDWEIIGNIWQHPELIRLANP